MKYYKSNIVANIVKLIVIIIAIIGVEYSSSKEEVKSENLNLNKTLDLAAMTETIAALEITDIYDVKSTLEGSLTGYAADCPKCNGRLGCSPYLDVSDGTLFYEDETFGKVRIVAASKSLPCGSVITFKSIRVPNGEIVAIVLDRGVRGTSIDLLTESEEYASKNIGRSTITYDILRNGWESE